MISIYITVKIVEKAQNLLMKKDLKMSWYQNNFNSYNLSFLKKNALLQNITFDLKFNLILRLESYKFNNTFS